MFIDALPRGHPLRGVSTLFGIWPFLLVVQNPILKKYTGRLPAPQRNRHTGNAQADAAYRAFILNVDVCLPISSELSSICASAAPSGPVAFLH